jgi:hypothetical protein
VSLTTETWSRNSFDVECVQVTDANIISVATWCQGEIKYNAGAKRYVRFQATPNTKPITVNAHIGDWVLFVDGRFKHYRDAAFKTAYSKKRSFVPEIREILRTALSVECTAVWDQHDVAEYYTDMIVKLIEGEQ